MHMSASEVLLTILIVDGPILMLCWCYIQHLRISRASVRRIVQTEGFDQIPLTREGIASIETQTKCLAISLFWQSRPPKDKPNYLEGWRKNIRIMAEYNANEFFRVRREQVQRW